MRKGEEKRQELLNAAEKLFCAKGYEGTSVQDILNVAEMSKGGFYHHFASKEDVIKALCARRAERALAYTEDALSKAESSMGRINAVLRGFMPLRREESTFVDMLRPVMNTPEELDRLFKLTLTEQQKEDILWNNAIRFLHLEEAAKAKGL